jgi:hypothetical protein
MRYEKKIGERMLRYFVEDDGFPTFVKFARLCGVTPADLDKWRKTSKHFREVYGQCSAILCDTVADGALHRTLDPSFSKFYLSTQHGWGEGTRAGENEFSLRVTVGDADGEDGAESSAEDSRKKKTQGDGDPAGEEE